jgi:5'(3')-deoxyribonucleotidase
MSPATISVESTTLANQQSIPLETGQSSTFNILTTLGRSNMYKDGVLVKQQILCLMINGHDNRMIAYVTDPIFFRRLKINHKTLLGICVYS